MLIPNISMMKAIQSYITATAVQDTDNNLWYGVAYIYINDILVTTVHVGHGYDDRMKAISEAYWLGQFTVIQGNI